MPKLRDIASGLDALVAEVDAILDEPDGDEPAITVPPAYRACLVADCELVPRTRQELANERRQRDIESLMRNRRRDSLD